MPKLKPDRPSLDSRFNQVIQFALTASSALSAASLSENPWVSTMIGLAVTGAMIRTWNYASAAFFINRNHQPQTLYQIPWHEGVLVTQPVHHLALNPWKWWRGRFRDTMTDEVYQIHGYFANADLADQYCQNVMKAGAALRLTPDDPNPLLRTLALRTIEKAAIDLEGPHPVQPQTQVPSTVWNVSPLPDDPLRYSAYRQVLTIHGKRWEFIPQPPNGMKDTFTLKKLLAEDRAWSSPLDDRIVDHALQPMTHSIRQAWERQSAPWRLVPLDTPDPLQAQQWAACQVDPVSGAVRTWIPRPPASAPRENVWQTLRADLAPGAPEPPLPSHWEAIQAQWVQAAVPVNTARPLGPAITVRADHPVLTAWPGLSLTQSPPTPQWAVVAQTIAGRTRWMALQATPTTDGVQLRPLHRLDDPGKLWLSHDPTVLEHTIMALTRGQSPPPQRLTSFPSVLHPTRSLAVEPLTPQVHRLSF